MSRRVRVVLIVGGSIFALLLLLGVTGLLVVQSRWFHDKVRDRIVTTAETATGGRVEIQRFDFDWHTLTATLAGVTIHGTEPAADPPLLHADRLVIGLKIISLLKRDVDLALLRIDRPQTFLLVNADGTTNVPNPKTPSKSNKSAVDTILDLAVKRFEINDGSAKVRGAGQPPKTQAYAAKGDNLKALLTFDGAVPRYHGDLSMAPLALHYGSYQPLPLNVNTTVAIERNRLIVEKSTITSGDSQIQFNGRIQDFNAPVITAEYKAKVSLAEMGTLMKLTSHQSGWLTAEGSASYKTATDYGIGATLKAYDVAYRTSGIALRNIRAEAKVNGGPQSIAINDLKAFALGGELTAKAEIRDFERFRINGELHHFDVRDLAALATRQKIPYDAMLSGPLFSEGKISDIARSRVVATARLGLTPAGRGTPVHGLLDAKYDGIHDTVDLGQSFVALPNSRLDVSGILGQQLKLRFASSNLNDLLPAMQMAAKPGQQAPQIPVTVAPQGQLLFTGVVTGKLANPTVAGHLGGSGFVVQSQTIDAVSADLSANQSGASITNGTLRQKTLSASFSGSVGLRNWSPENDEPLRATLGLRNANLQELLALAGQKAIPASGTLAATSNIAGTVGNPQATADLTLTRGDLQGEPFDRLTAHVDAPGHTTQAITAQLTAGAKQVNLKANYAHGATEFFPGKLTFNVASNNIAMNQVVTLHQREPDLLGSAKISANGTIDITRDATGKPAVAISRIDGDVAASGLEIAGRRLGDLNLTANTVITGGQPPAVDVKLRSNLADAAITADGRWALSGDYPGSATLQFSKVNLDTVRRLALTPSQMDSVRVGGSIEGTLHVSGPAAKPELLQATLEIPKVEVHPLPGSPGAGGPVDLTIRNAAPIRVSLANGVVTVESAKITAQESSFAFTGKATLTPRQNLRSSGKWRRQPRHSASVRRNPDHLGNRCDACDCPW